MNRPPPPAPPPTRKLRARWLLVVAPIAVLACAVLIPPPTWLLERLPDSALRWESRRFSADSRPDRILGDRLLAMGQTRSATRHLSQAAGRDADDVAVLVSIADATAASGLAANAEAQARGLLKIEPRSGRLHRILGQSLLQMGRPAEALASLGEATRLAPTDADAWIALAEARIAIEGFGPAAAQVWEAAVKQNPQHGSLRHGLAETYAQLGRYEEAEAALRDLTGESAPTTPKPRELYARAWAARGIVLRRLRPDAARRAEAKQSLERALSLAPSYPDTHYEMALLLADEGQWAAAKEQLESATRLRPYAHPFWYHLARVYRRLGLRDAAARADARFDLLVGTFPAVNRDMKHLDAHPDDLPRRLSLARLLLQRDDRDAAVQQLALILRDQPRHAEATRLMQRLRSSPRSPGGAPVGE